MQRRQNIIVIKNNGDFKSNMLKNEDSIVKNFDFGIDFKCKTTFQEMEDKGVNFNVLPGIENTQSSILFTKYCVFLNQGNNLYTNCLFGQYLRIYPQPAY